MTGSVAILGATGFLGTALWQRLEADGVTVVGVGRRSRPDGVEGQYHALPPEPTADDWLGALRDVGSVLNLVGYAHYAGRSRSEIVQGLFRANVETCAHVLAACREAGVTDVLHVSSVKALGETAGEPLSSAATPRPTTLYGHTKRAGELLVRQAGATGGPRTTVIRLPLVYGPGARGNVERLVRAVQAGRVIPIPSVEGRRSVVSVNRVAAGVMACLRATPDAATLHICDPEPITFSDMVGAVGDALGRSPRTVRVPATTFGRVLRAAGKTEIAARLTQDLVMQTDLRDVHPPTRSRAGTLQEFGALVRG